ncbi:hypothetical protein GCM10027085_04190 [Spirosoma aerophilum]
MAHSTHNAVKPVRLVGKLGPVAVWSWLPHKPIYTQQTTRWLPNGTDGNYVHGSNHTNGYTAIIIYPERSGRILLFDFNSHLSGTLLSKQAFNVYRLG